MNVQALTNKRYKNCISAPSRGGQQGAKGTVDGVLPVPEEGCDCEAAGAACGC